MGRGKLGESWRAPNASWGVTGADGKRAGCRRGFQGAAWEIDIPRLATGACQGTVGFCFWRAVRGSARVLVLTGDWSGSAEDGLCPCAVWGCGALNLGRRFLELTLPQAKEYNPYRVEMAPTHTLPRREGLFVPFGSL